MTSGPPTRTTRAMSVRTATGLCQVVDRDADRRGVEGGGLEWKNRGLVQVVDDVRFQTGVCHQLGHVHAQADDPAVIDLGRQVADPRTHQVENFAAGRQGLAVDLGDGGDGAVVDVGDEARLPVEPGVGGLILAAKAAVHTAPHDGRSGRDPIRSSRCRPGNRGWRGQSCSDSGRTPAAAPPKPKGRGWYAPTRSTLASGLISASRPVAQ